MFDIEEWLPFLLAKSHQEAHSMMKDAVADFGLTPPQFATLAFLWKCDGFNQHELGCLMRVDRTTIGGIIDRLEKLGYIRREPDPQDRRSYVLFVTPRGKLVRDDILSSLETVGSIIDGRLTREEQQQLYVLLRKFRMPNPKEEEKNDL